MWYCSATVRNLRCHAVWWKRGGGNVREAIFTLGETRYHWKTPKPINPSFHQVVFIIYPKNYKTSTKQYWDSNLFLSCTVVPCVSLVITLCFHCPRETCLGGILNYRRYLHAPKCQSGKTGIKEKKNKSVGRRKEYPCLIICYEQRFLQKRCQFPFASMSKRSTGPCISVS